MIPGEKAGVKITSGMVRCIEDFHTRKLALISKKEEVMLLTLQEEIKNIEDESQKKDTELLIDDLKKTMERKRIENVWKSITLSYFCRWQHEWNLALGS